MVGSLHSPETNETGLLLLGSRHFKAEEALIIQLESGSTEQNGKSVYYLG
jgi:hypothetical protein